METIQKQLLIFTSGYEGSLTENADFYAQIGPAFNAVDGTDGTETEFYW